MVLYFTKFASSKRQGTIGKRLLRIKVVNKHGERLTTKDSFKRNSARLLSWIAGIGYIQAFFTKYNRTFHDFAASTFVLDDFDHLRFQHIRKPSKNSGPSKRRGQEETDPSDTKPIIKSDPKARRRAISNRFK